MPKTEEQTIVLPPHERPKPTASQAAALERFMNRGQPVARAERPHQSRVFEGSMKKPKAAKKAR